MATLALDASAAVWPLLLVLFATGLWGGLTHCAGMCGPFVLAQVDRHLDAPGGTAFGRWSRLRGAALIPYHAGRLTTYMALGAVSGSLGAVLVELTALRWLVTGFLLLAAVLFAAQALGMPGPGASRLPAVLGKAVSRLSQASSATRHYALGVALGFLPCGLLYGAIAAAAAAGGALPGALAMGAFTLGTVPALVAVGWGGAILGARRRQALQRLTRPLLVVNAVLLFVLALGAAG